MSKELAVITEDKVAKYLKAMGLANELTTEEVDMFTEIAVAQNLNPFIREIYCVVYKGRSGRKVSFITGYEVYIKRAERSGQLNGWGCTLEGTRKDKTLRAVCTIHRKDWEHPFVHDAYWCEYAQDNTFWRNKPLTMIKKVAVAQAFRLAFPEQVAGLPYTEDEIGGSERDVTPDGNASPFIEQKPEASPEEQAEALFI